MRFVHIISAVMSDWQLWWDIAPQIAPYRGGFGEGYVTGVMNAIWDGNKEALDAD